MPMLPRYPEHFNLANVPTEFRALDRMSAVNGGPRIWIKHDDLTGSAVSGNKIRKLEFLCADALAQGAQVLLTCGGLQSNHCRATAITAARLGMRCHLLLRGPSSLEERAKPYCLNEVCGAEGFDGNVLLDVLAGASVSVYSPRYYAACLEQEFSRYGDIYREQGLTSYAIPVGGSDAVGLWAYVKAAKELIDDFRTHQINPQAIFCATGSGGTQGGLSLGLHLYGEDVPVVGIAVCDSKAYFHNKIRADIESWQARYACDSVVDEVSINTLDNYIGPGYAQGYPALYETIKQVARTEGVILDPVYTGKAFYGMLEEIRKGSMSSDGDIVFLHTGGVFGLFPFKEHFSDTSEGF